MTRRKQAHQGQEKEKGMVRTCAACLVCARALKSIHTLILTTTTIKTPTTAAAAAAAVALADAEATAGQVAAASLLSLVGLQARALAEAEEQEAAVLMSDLLDLKLRRLEGRVREHFLFDVAMVCALGVS